MKSVRIVYGVVLLMSTPLVGCAADGGENVAGQNVDEARTALSVGGFQGWHAVPAPRKFLYGPAVVFNRSVDELFAVMTPPTCSPRSCGPNFGGAYYYAGSQWKVLGTSIPFLAFVSAPAVATWFFGGEHLPNEEHATAVILTSAGGLTQVTTANNPGELWGAWEGVPGGDGFAVGTPYGVQVGPTLGLLGTSDALVVCALRPAADNPPAIYCATNSDRKPGFPAASWSPFSPVNQGFGSDGGAGLPAGVFIASGPTAAQKDPLSGIGSLSVTIAAMGSDHQYYTATTSDGVSWSAWTLQGCCFKSQPGFADRGASLDLFGIGLSDNFIYERSLGSEASFSRIPNLTFGSTTPSAWAKTPHSVRVGAVGTDGQVYTNTWSDQ